MEENATTSNEAYQDHLTQSSNASCSNKTTKSQEMAEKEQIPNKPPLNFIKVQDDLEPFYFEKKDGVFKIYPQAYYQNQGLENSPSIPYWLLNNYNPVEDNPYQISFNKRTLRQRIEPWLTALSQSEHLSLLIGSGLTSAVQFIAQGQSLNAMSADFNFGRFNKNIRKHTKDALTKNNRGNEVNIEDYIHSALDLLNGLKVQCSLIKDKPRPSLKTTTKVQNQSSNNQNHQEPLNDLVNDTNQNEALENCELSNEISPQEIENYFHKINHYKTELDARLNLLFKEFTKSICEIEHSIALLEDEDPLIHENKLKAFRTLISFLMSFANRPGSKDRLNIFTTNYDRLIEAGADLAGLRLIDRFVGNLSPIFRSSRIEIDMYYNTPGAKSEPRYLEGVVRFTKLHGSLDWINDGRDIRRIAIPFGALNLNPFLHAAGLNPQGRLKNPQGLEKNKSNLNKDAKACSNLIKDKNACYQKVMIYPNPAKDRETAEYPYVELFRDFAAALCRPNHTLFCYGYSFGDEHINRVIYDMLSIPSTHLVIINFDDNTGRILKIFEDWGKKEQMTLIVGQDVANLSELTQYYLPKPGIDKNMLRMQEILRNRFNQNPKSYDTN